MKMFVEMPVAVILSKNMKMGRVHSTFAWGTRCPLARSDLKLAGIVAKRSPDVWVSQPLIEARFSALPGPIYH